MGRIVDQSVRSTFKMTTGASVTTGDVLYATATDASVKPYAVQTPAFTTYTDTPITTFNTVAGAAASNNAIKVAYLTTGDYVIAYASSNNTPTFQRYNSSGVAQGSLTTIETVGTITSLSISALDSGNFVVAYNNTTTNVKAAVYNSTGTQLVAPFVVEAVSASSVIAAPMTGGGFVVVYNNTSTNIRYGNYNIAGVLQGSLTTLATGNYAGSSNIVDAKPLSDGQVAVCYALSTGQVRYAHIGTNGAISVTDTLAFTANNTQTWPRVCPTSGGSYVLCVAYATNVQNRVISSAGVMTPFQQDTGTGVATVGGRTAIPMPISVTAGTNIQVAPNSVTGGGTMVFTNGTTSYYYRFDNQGCQINDFQALQGTTSSFVIRGIAANGNDTVIAYYNNSSIPSFVRFSATTNTNLTPGYITPVNNLISTPIGIPPLSSMYSTTNSIGYSDACTLSSGDIAIVAINSSYPYGCHLTIMGQDGRIKLQKWVVVDIGTISLTFVSIAALTNGGFVIATQSNNSSTGQWAYIYNSTAQFVNAVRVDTLANSTNIVVTGLTGGSFAIAYNDTGNTQSKYAVYSNTGATVLAPTAIPTYHTSTVGRYAIASMVDGGFVITVCANTFNSSFFARYTATGTQVAAMTSIGGVAGTLSVAGSTDNGWAIIFYGSSTQMFVHKYSSGNTFQWQIALTPSTVLTSYAPKIIYCPINNYFTTLYSVSGPMYQVHKFNLQGFVINQTTSTTTGQSFTSASYNSTNYALVPQINDNIVAVGASSASTLLNYTTISQGYTIVGVAGESASANTEIDVIVDGVTTLNKSYAPVTLSSFGANPSGVKGLVTGLTAELTRQRNNLG